MPAWAGIILGIVILAFVFADRQLIGRAWRKPARFWRLDEAWESRAPSQPCNVAAGLILGLAAIAYGVNPLLVLRREALPLLRRLPVWRPGPSRGPSLNRVGSAAPRRS